MLNPTTVPYQQNGAPSFIADLLAREHVLAGGAKIDAAAFNSADAVKVVVNDAAAAAADTSVTVEALPAALPAAAILAFDDGTFARLSAAADAGATTLAVDALSADISDNAVAYYNAPGAPKRVASGTLVGCTFAELEAAPALTDGVPAGLLWGPAADADDIVHFVVYDNPDVDTKNDVDLLRHGTLIYVNHIPGWADFSAALKAKVRAAYEITIGGTEV
jgi:hypothetical protein